jgi:hypothetical protein
MSSLSGIGMVQAEFLALWVKMNLSTIADQIYKHSFFETANRCLSVFVMFRA